MPILCSAMAAVLVVLPAEWHIDSSGCNGAAARTKIDIRITGMDGTGFTTGIALGDEPDPETAQLLLRLALEDNGYTLAPVGKSILVIRGRKSPIRSIEFDSKGWKPGVRWLPRLPEKQK